MVRDADLPALYLAADKSSLRGQKTYLKATALRLSLLVVAAACGAFTLRTGSVDVTGVVAAVAFGAALLSEIYLFRARPDRLWYDGRAAAESAKTLAWRYMVGGNPFGKEEINDSDADILLLKRLNEVIRDLRGVPLVPVTGSSEQITDRMRELRSKPLHERRAEYKSGRIDDQAGWYSRKAQWNEARATAWSLVLALLEGLGLVGAILRAAMVIDVDALGLIGALVAAGAAWLQTKQHQTLASAYSVATHELSLIAAGAVQLQSDPQWASFVDEAEEAISREHTLWRASHRT